MIYDNFTMVFVTNFFALVNLIGLGVANRYCIRNWNGDGKYIMYTFCITGISCIADPISYLMIGKQGLLAKNIMLLCNTWMYVSYVMVCIVGIQFAIHHMHIKNKKKWNLLCVILFFAGVDLLIINLVVPVVFYIDVQNVFYRKNLAGLFFGLICITVLMGNAMYLQRKKCSEFVQFFSIGYLGIPLVIGTVIQYMFYGISVLYAFETITLGMVISSIKNEYIYQDRLTGMYNPAFMPYLWNYLESKKRQQLAYVVVYVKDLQEIDDKFGIETGDKALFDLSRILQKSVTENAKIVRYNRATFVTLIGGEQETTCLKMIQNDIYEYNQENAKMYHLNVHFWSETCNIKQMSLEQFRKNITNMIQGEQAANRKI